MRHICSIRLMLNRFLSCMNVCEREHIERLEEYQRPIYIHIVMEVSIVSHIYIDLHTRQIDRNPGPNLVLPNGALRML